MKKSKTVEEIQKSNSTDKTDGFEQLSLFEEKEWWEDEWQDMPEFIQKDLQPYQTILLHFPNRKSKDEFAELVKQKITSKTKFLWYPAQEIRTITDKRYVDEN